MSVTRTILVPPTVTDKQLDELDARGIRPIIDYGGAVYDENGFTHVQCISDRGCGDLSLVAAGTETCPTCTGPVTERV